MLERMRAAIAAGVGAVMSRLTVEPRYTQASRVPATIRTLAGVAVTPDLAVTIPTVWACLRYLSQTVAVLPWHAMKETDAGGELAKDNAIDWLLWKRPNPEWSSFQFRETLTHWALRWGNGYAEIERDIYGRPIAMWPLHPERVEVCRDPETNILFYEVNNGTGAKAEIEARDIFHVRGFGEGPVGVNVIQYAAQSLGWARAAQLFGASFFGEGMNVTGVVTTKKKLSPEAFKRMKEELKQLYKGVRGERTAVLDQEMDWKSVGIDPDKAQFILTHQHLVEEICRWFGVPPHKVMHLLRSTFNNIEHQAIEVVVDSISPWVKRFEDEADFKLFGEKRWRGFYTKMNMNALLRGDMKARMEFYKGMMFVGALTPNDILRLEDMNTIGEAGDVHLIQQQFIPLERAGDHLDARGGQESSPPDDDGELEEDVASTAARNRVETILELAQ